MQGKSITGIWTGYSWKQAVPVLRYALGSTLILAVAAGAGYILSYITPVLALTFLAPGVKPLTLRSGFFLVVSESFHPWWTAYLDGRPVPVHPGQFAFLGLFMPAGEHRLELRFQRPPTYYLWALVSCASLAAAGLFLYLSRGEVPAGGGRRPLL